MGGGTGLHIGYGVCYIDSEVIEVRAFKTGTYIEASVTNDTCLIGSPVIGSSYCIGEKVLMGLGLI